MLSTSMVSGLWRPESSKFCNLHAGIPVKYFPDNLDVIKPVQYAALFSDLVKHTRFALKQLEIND